MFEIEKDVPAPADGVPGQCRYPFHSMKKGDSFFVPGAAYSNLYQAAYKHCRTLRGIGKKFVVRQEDGGARCWRVA